ncbi:MAG: HindIII family type II restriction endonuclease, partial [Elusimicrobiaceae bacterium]|nr:HindIII family type II restriction endonuclease [Elusimicrobiaceae bacterium]
MDVKQAYYYIKNFVDKNNNKNTDMVASEFEATIKNLPDEDIIYLLLFSGFIPDLYLADSSDETLYSKLVEVLVCVWAQKLNFESKYVKQKASYEDVYLEKNNKVIVCDAKSFRLGRSQKAPNVKDFIKLEDIRKWLNRYGTKKLGGLVTYPDTHEWTADSDTYQYCSTKEIPTVMLPYKYMALILFFKEKLKYNDILS